MPSAVAGFNISDSAQINPGVIVNSDINAAAAIDYTKLALALSIVNADIATNAAIVDTKLAQIATASKVSGAALTLLANIPAGAGIVPAANLPNLGATITTSATPVTVVSTTTETNLASYSLAGGVLGTAGQVHLHIPISNMSALANNGTITFYYGATTVTTAIVSQGGAFGSLKGVIDCYIIAAGATNSQRLILIQRLESDKDTLSLNEIQSNKYTSGTAAIDSTAAQTVKCTITWVVGDASHTITTDGYIITN